MEVEFMFEGGIPRHVKHGEYHTRRYSSAISSKKTACEPLRRFPQNLYNLQWILYSLIRHIGHDDFQWLIETARNK